MHMKTIRTMGCLGLLAWALLSSTALAATKAEFEQAMSHDGLQKITVKGIATAYARPGASLATYDRVKIDPVEVAVSRNWDPTRTGSRIKLSTEERENIRNGVARIVQEEFVKELQGQSSYKVVEAAGPDVLRVKVNIVNLYVNAPDTLTAGSSRTYTVTAGQMTLFMELFDSESGEILARLVDKREARDNQMLMLTNSVVNRGEAQDIAAHWARVLRKALDNAHGIGKK